MAGQPSGDGDFQAASPPVEKGDRQVAAGQFPQDFPQTAPSQSAFSTGYPSTEAQIRPLPEVQASYDGPIMEGQGQWGGLVNP
jgi:hypothetical protein